MMFVGLLVLSSIYGFARGGRPEQIGAATLVLGVLASIAFSHPVALQFQSVEAGILGVDLSGPFVGPIPCPQLTLGSTTLEIFEALDIYTHSFQLYAIRKSPSK